ncbi:MAG: Trk system potassium transporter TrkA [Oscillospiraceae bacterium]
MRIIVVGMSSIGSFLVKILSSRPEYDVTVIDSRKQEVDRVTDLYNAAGICGSGSSRSVLMKAGADTADVVVALTPVDEINIMCCMIAKSCGTRYTAAMIYQPDLAEETDYFKGLASIDYVINPRLAAAEEISLQAGLTGRVKTDALFGGNAVMLRTRVDGGSRLDGKTMAEIRQIFTERMLVGTVCRGSKIFIPDGKFQLRAGDEMEIITAKSSVPSILKSLELPDAASGRVLIIGCGTTGYYLARHFIGQKKSVRIVERDMARCRILTELFPNTEITCITDADSLMQQDLMKNVDVCVCLTGEDDRNLVNSLYAWSCGVRSVITRISSPQYENLLRKTDIQITVSPVVTAAERLLGFIRNIAFNNEKGDDIGQINLIADGGAEAIEFMAYDNCKALDIPFSSPDFRLNKDVIIALIIRNGETMIPDGKSVIKSGDRVIAVTKSGGRYNTLNEIFR